MTQHAAPPAIAGRSIDVSLRARMEAIQTEASLDFGGGASLTKALVLGDLIVGGQLRTVVELGVYRGRLLLALGALLDGLGGGEAIGVDPYSATAAEQTDEHSRGFDLNAWAHDQDWDAIHDGVLATIARWGIGERTRIIREHSLDVASRFDRGSIDLLHVDGNHDAAAVEADLAAYLPAVRRGGFVVLDDASWPSVRRSCGWLTDHQRLVLSLFDGGFSLDGVGGNDFAVFEIIDDAVAP